MRIVSSIKPAVAAQWGLALLIVPIYFISASALRQDAPGLSLLGNPMILLGSLLLAFTLSALPILSVNLRSDAPPVLSVSLSLRFWNLTVIVTGLLLLGVLLGYAFVENFQARLGS
jgi:hydrogenase-4 membrane subunit HyfE